MTAAAKDPVRVRNMDQFREGSFGRKFSPSPMYLYIGFGFGRGLTSGLISGLGIDEDAAAFYRFC